MILTFNKNYKELLGKLLFMASIVMFFYMIFSPFNNLVYHIDENFTIFLLKFPVSDIFSITAADVHPPLYYLICKAALKLLTMFNINFNIIQVLRFVSIIPYFIILLISYFKFRKDYNWLVVGLFTFSLIVMSDFFTYLMNIRMYSWGLLFLLLSFIYFKEVITNFDYKSWILLTLFTILGAYTHYYVAISTFLIYVSLFIYLMYYKQSEIKYFALSVFSNIILFLPWTMILFGQIKKVHENFWVQEVDFNLLIDCFSFFGPRTHDFYFNCLLILFLIIFFVIFINQYKHFEDIDTWYIVTGFGVFIGTIVIGAILSVIYKPVLIVRYLIPSTAILWFVLSILVSKIEDKKLFIISIALILVLCVSGISTLISHNEELIEWGDEQMTVFDQINKDENALVVFSNPTALADFSPFLNESEIYIKNFNEYLSVDSNRIQKFYNFKELSLSDINKTLENHEGKHVYLIEAYSELDLDDKYHENLILTYGEKINFYSIE